MNKELKTAIWETLETLVVLARARASPDEALKRFRLSTKSHPEIQMDLVWQYEPFDNSFHYDALLRSDGGTVSVSFCVDGTPWPLRGVQRWNMNEVVRVNGRSVTIDKVIGCLDFVWNELQLTQRLIDISVVQEEIDRRDIQVSDDELQVEMDLFRSRRKLFATSETHKWLAAQGVSRETLERHLEGEVAAHKLRKLLVDGHLATYLEAHLEELDVLDIFYVSFNSETEASRLAYELHGVLDLCVVEKFTPCPSILRKRRCELSAELSEILSSRSVGEIIGPWKINNCFAIASVLKITKAQLDESTREFIETLLFDDWLRERRSRSSVEWFWGQPSRAK